MHRIDTEGHAAGLFQDGTPQIGQQGTIMDADWANGVQENICGVIEGAGMPLEKGDHQQLKDAIAQMIANAQTTIINTFRTPVGTVIRLDGPTPPAGYLPLDGGQHLRADFPDLVAFYTDQARLLAGDTEAQFRVPDYRGRFDRAWSADAAVDPAGPRAPGSLQADELKSHLHPVNPTSSDSEGGAGRTVTGNTGTSESLPGYNTGFTGGAETRPKNVAFLWAIKT